MNDFFCELYHSLMKCALLLFPLLLGTSGGIRAGHGIQRREFVAAGFGTSLFTPLASTAATRSAPAPSQAEIDKYLGSVIESGDGYLDKLAFEMFDDESDYKPGGAKFRRLDATEDSLFYDKPKLVEHIDQRAVEALTRRNVNLISEEKAVNVLDMCAR